MKEQEIMNEFADLLRENTKLKQRIRELELQLESVEKIILEKELQNDRTNSRSRLLDRIQPNSAVNSTTVFFEYAPCKDVACELAMAVPLSLVIVASALFMLGAY